MLKVASLLAYKCQHWPSVSTDSRLGWFHYVSALTYALTFPHESALTHTLVCFLISVSTDPYLGLFPRVSALTHTRVSFFVCQYWPMLRLVSLCISTDPRLDLFVLACQYWHMLGFRFIRPVGPRACQYTGPCLGRSFLRGIGPNAWPSVMTHAWICVLWSVGTDVMPVSTEPCLGLFH